MNKKIYIITTTILVLLVLAVTVEVIGKWYIVHMRKKCDRPKFRFNSYRVYEHIPGYTETGEDGVVRIAINGQGFRRSSETVKEKTKNTFRVFLMGGSAGHGVSSPPPFKIYHVRQNETIDSFLEVKLQEKYPNKKIEVINACVTGYQVFQHTHYLLSEILNYSPDAVIFFDGANDHYKPWLNYDYYEDFPYQFWKKHLQEPSLSGLKNYFVLMLSGHSSFFRGWYAYILEQDAANRKTFIVSDDVEKMVKAYRTSSPRGYLRSVNANIQILKANKIKSILCLQPMFALRSRDSISPEEENVLKLLGFNPVVKGLYPYVASDLSGLARENKVDFIDANLFFAKPENIKKHLFTDYCHLTPEGNRVVAEAMFPMVDKMCAELKY